ncbi:MAG TPA: hypothetical protein V6C71_27160 [Coleofasciculaceae cyanobacterium]|jgi:hypothetical protein
MTQQKPIVANFRLSAEEKQILKATANNHFGGKISTMVRYFVFSGVEFLEALSNSDQSIQLIKKNNLTQLKTVK